MGLLDEAIREHLDLQRRRGADPAEVERAEREALGPVRRGTAGAEQADDGVDHELVHEDEYEPDWGVSSEQQPDPLEAAADLGPSSRSEEPPIASEAGPVPEAVPPHEPAASEEPSGSPPPPPDEPLGDSPEAAPAPHAAPPAPAADSPSEQVDGATVEYDVEGAPEREGDDVLEETPEFLQETPDHDRLWFEQRPPRDFDFDG